jgi:hypothetical protein
MLPGRIGVLAWMRFGTMVDAGARVASAGVEVRIVALLFALAASVSSAFSADMSATVTLTGSKPGRPPLERLYVDVVLANPGARPRWALIPTNVPRMQGGVDKLEQLSGTATIGRLLGTGGRYAVLLAPGARLALRNLEINWWRGKETGEIAFEIEFVDDVRLGGEPLESWFEGDPLVRGSVEVDMKAARHAASHRAQGDREVSVSLAVLDHIPIKLRAP